MLKQKERKKSNGKSKQENPKKVLLRIGCWRTQIKVTPENWSTSKASTYADWVIWSRYHDPRFKTKYPKGKYLVKRGMNDTKDLKARQACTDLIIDELEKLLDVHHYNPITEKINPLELKSDLPAEDLEGAVTDNTLFLAALWHGFKQLSYVPKAMDDVKSVIRGVGKAAKALQYDLLPISVIRPMHIVRIFNWLKANNVKFSDKRQKKYKAYLMGIFWELVDLERCGRFVDR
ncbi:hypothetical protein [Chitinophaga sp. sic0106]|uniref:hypothetical protein n=1 Tax=Chitinophaga sp. sic0106 TaxID=2854785 RepID=UPI001C487E9C|nr:hypothetical protein [Chitinophaga sp. sic0106]MBV7531801.1 hypothetical protein [Chitinophaga sp. sic0106]